MTGSSAERLRGLELSVRFYEGTVRPLLAGVPHAAALLGEGSEVLGFDDDVSPDHDFGERVQIFVESELSTMDGVDVTTPADFFRQRIGVDPADGMALDDWLLTPTQRFATLTGGSVFHDPYGWLAVRREALRWYPDDVWRYVLAAGWQRIGEESPFVGRTGGTADDLGSRILAGRLARDMAALAFLIERRWAPYPKWFGRAFQGLTLAAELGPALARALAADAWRQREAALCDAAEILGAATNRLGLSEAVDPMRRQFYTRDIRVVDSGGFVHALLAPIVDPAVRELLARLGPNELPGSIDQCVDSVHVLTRPRRCRAAAAMLGLSPTMVE